MDMFDVLVNIAAADEAVAEFITSALAWPGKADSDPAEFIRQVHWWGLSEWACVHALVRHARRTGRRATVSLDTGTSPQLTVRVEGVFVLTAQSVTTYFIEDWAGSPAPV